MGYAEGGEMRVVRGTFGEDAMNVGACNAGERLNKCTAGWNEFAVTDHCKAGNGISVEVKCKGAANGDARVRGDPREWSVPEVFKDGNWYPVCGHYFWNNHEGAASVCKGMGYRLAR